jgi:DNA polymerase III delta prime subunit
MQKGVKMTQYDFHKLLDTKEFETFGKDILEIRENLKFEVFSDGPDQGIDIRYKDQNILIIGQAKRYKEFNALYNELKKEVSKVESLNPDRYIIITSVSLTPKNKEKIAKLFKKYIKTDSDIIGETDLNTYLGNPKYKKVEESYPQLWINSSNVLKNIIKKEVHSEIYNKTNIILAEIRKSCTTYVKNDCFEAYFKNLEKKKCLLICGEPGIGKTTLAYNLISKFLTKYKDTEFIVLEKINEFYKVYDENKKQLFLIDDFWGIKFSDSQKDTDLKKILEIITKMNNKNLILTSREYILKQGYLEYPELESFFEKYKIKLNTEDFSDLFKARILFRNLENSNLDYYAIYELANSYVKIINNSNYSPRVIEAYLSYLNEIEYEIHDYKEDIIKYLNNPQELWKEIFAKQSEGAQLLAMLILLFDNPVELEDLKKLFYSCLDNNYKINARKKDFLAYISQLENTIITTYTDEFLDDGKIYFRFKNSSMELYVYSYFNKVIDEYGECIVKSSTCLNNLIRLMNFNQSLSYDYYIDYNVKKVDFNIDENLQNQIIDKFINEFDKLYYIEEKDEQETYIEDKNSKILRLVIIMNVYDKIKNQKLKKFIYEKSELIMKEFYEKGLNYNDSLLLFCMIRRNIDINIGNKFNILNILEEYWKNLKFSRQLLEIKWCEKTFPEEYKIFAESKNLEQEIIELTIRDAEDFLDELIFCTTNEERKMVYAMIDELTEFIIPTLFEEFNMKYKKWYVQEIYEITGNKLFDAKEKWLKELDYNYKKDDEIKEEELVEPEINYDEEVKIIEAEQKDLLENCYKHVLKYDEIKTYLNNNLKDKKLLNKIMKKYNDSEDYCITPLLEDYEKLKFLQNYLDYRNKLDKNISEFFEGIITYLKNKYEDVNENTINNLKKIAYDTLNSGSSVMYESQILKYITIDELDNLKKSRIIYNIGKKYYFITIELHIIFAIYESININKLLINIFENIFSSHSCDFYNYINDICCIYSDIDNYKFNKEFLLPTLKEFKENRKSNNKEDIVKKFIKKLGISLEIIIETDINGIKSIEPYCSTIDSTIKIIALEYIGFEPFDLIFKEKSDEEIIEIFEKYFPENKSNIYELNLSTKYSKIQEIVKELGIFDYIYKLYNFIFEKIKCLENDITATKINF